MVKSTRIQWKEVMQKFVVSPDMCGIARRTIDPPSWKGNVGGGGAVGKCVGTSVGNGVGAQVGDQDGTAVGAADGDAE